MALNFPFRWISYVVVSETLIKSIASKPSFIRGKRINEEIHGRRNNTHHIEFSSQLDWLIFRILNKFMQKLGSLQLDILWRCHLICPAQAKYCDTNSKSAKKFRIVFLEFGLGLTTRVQTISHPMWES